MRQQINLYQPTLTHRRAALCARNVGVALGLFIAALCSHSGWNQVQLNRAERDVETLRAQQAAQQAQLDEAMSTHSAPGAADALEARVHKLQASVDERRRALQVLRSGAAGRTAGFAARLEALARRSIDGLWIDHLVLSASDASMALSGAALDVDAVPAWLQGLTQEPVLAGARFDDFIIERPPAAKGVADANVAGAKAFAPAQIRFRVGRSALKKASPETSS